MLRYSFTTTTSLSKRALHPTCCRSTVGSPIPSIITVDPKRDGSSRNNLGGGRHWLHTRTCFVHAPSRHRQQQVRNQVFVSRHNQSLNITSKQILDCCSHHGIDTHQARTNSSHVILKECPFCTNPTNGKLDNLYKLYIKLGDGAYMCHRCGASGSWYDLKRNLGGYQVVGVGPSHNNGTSNATAPQSRRGRATNPSTKDNFNKTSLPMPPPTMAALYGTRLLDEGNNPVLEYLVNERHLTTATLRKYGVGRATYSFPSQQGSYVSSDCVTFPWILRASDVAVQESLRGHEYQHDAAKDPWTTRRIKARSIEQKAWQRLDPPGGGWGLFGFHTVPEDAKEIVLTEGEYDAMAVNQATQLPAVSLPNGCRSLPPEVLPMLERFEKIYLWMDHDGPGQEGAEKFARKIGLNRCFIVQPKPDGPAPKDANDALRMGVNMKQMIRDAAILPHEQIMTFSEFRSDVLNEILNPDQYSGVPVPSLKQFTDLIKGFRRGEMTVLTGPTGSGKTTFLGQISLDLVEQGINCLWGSFEIKNTRLLRKLMQQFQRGPLPLQAREELEALADRFEELPLYFMKFHGGSDVDDVLDAMDYAVYVNDVEHIILDNMQFMISRNAVSGSTFDKFDVQDMAIEKFRKFATDKNVHVTLVVHPRKEDESNKLSISSFYGSAKATQEADTVLILQKDNNRKYIDVKKNRFDGTIGTSPLFFDHQSGRYTETQLLPRDGSGGDGVGSRQSGPTLTPRADVNHFEKMFGEQ